MAQAPRTEITFPIARLVQGSLTEPNTKDADGNPLLVKNGPDKGQARLDYFFAIAIPKSGKPWWEEPWGQTIYQVGYAAFGQAANSTAFAWKIKDGDSQVPNSKGNKPCDQEGFPGHWVLSLSSGFPPTVYNANGSAQLADPKVVKPGHYIQVAATISSNESQTKPGIYLNHSMVAHSGYGIEIQLKRDASKAGFGQGPAPAGMSAVPMQQAQFPQGAPQGPGAAMPGPGAGMPQGPGGYPQQPVPGPGAGYPQPGAAMPGQPAGPGGYPQPGAAMPGPGAGMPQQVAVQPNPGAMMPGPGQGYAPPQGAPQGPGGYPQPGVQQPQQQPAGRNARRMNAALANNWDLDQMVAGGWTDQGLIQAGHMSPY